MPLVSIVLAGIGKVSTGAWVSNWISGKIIQRQLVVHVGLERQLTRNSNGSSGSGGAVAYAYRKLTLKIEAGADPISRCNSGETAFLIVLGSGSIELVSLFKEILLSWGIDFRDLYNSSDISNRFVLGKANQIKEGLRSPVTENIIELDGTGSGDYEGKSSSVTSSLTSAKKNNTPPSETKSKGPVRILLEATSDE